ncbi:MAG: S8 family serine peptidase [Microthrixaceae bacterium]
MPRMSRCLFALGCALLALPAAAAQGAPGANDPVFEQGLQWGLDRIGAPAAWARGTGRGITIAIVDSGVDLQHEDLRSKVVGSVSCIGSGGDSSKCSGSAQDDNGHGTHGAGIALAVTDNGAGVAGVAPDARLLAVRVLSNDCTSSGCTASGTAGDVSAGIRWAVDHGADVINLSLGGGTMQSALGCSFCDAIDDAWNKGAIAVVAAGNDSVLPAGFADEPAVVVTATNRDDGRASYSSASSSIVRAARWPVAAPGGEAETRAADCATGGTPKGVLSTYWTAGQHDQYACLAGTSMAAPHVSGALAVLRSMGYTKQGAIDRLMATAKDLGPAGRDDTFGYGRIDLSAAVGRGPAATTTTTLGTAPTSTAPPGSSAPTTTTVTTPTSGTQPVREGPRMSTPEVSAAAPFRPPGGGGSAPPGWLVALAALAILGTGAAASLTAWRMLGYAPSSTARSTS